MLELELPGGGGDDDDTTATTSYLEISVRPEELALEGTAVSRQRVDWSDLRVGQVLRAPITELVKGQGLWVQLSPRIKAHCFCTDVSSNLEVFSRNETLTPNP